MSKLKGLIQAVGDYATENTPTILSVVGIAGVVVTAIFAAEGALKAEKIMEEEEPFTQKEDRKPADTIAKTWHCYIPAVASGAVTVTAIVASNRISKARIAALASAYALSTDNFKKYRDKVKEILGEKNDQKVVDDVNKDRVSQIDTNSCTIINSGGSTLCMDSLTGQLNWIDIDKVQKAVALVNKMLIDQQWVSVNDYLWELNFNQSKLLDAFGWDVGSGGVQVSYTSALTKDNIPCLVLNYSVEPSKIGW